MLLRDQNQWQTYMGSVISEAMWKGFPEILKKTCFDERLYLLLYVLSTAKSDTNLLETLMYFRGKETQRVYISITELTQKGKERSALQPFRRGFLVPS